MSSNALNTGPWLLRGEGLVRAILVDDSLVSMRRLGRKFLYGGRSIRAPGFNQIIDARCCGCGAKGDIFFP